MEPFCYNATVVRIVDGDTIRLDIDLGFDIVLKNRSVRLYKVDTPECRTRDLKEKAAGLLSKEVVQNLIAVGERVFIRTKLDTKGKFGRLMGTIITTDNININEHLINNNYAVEYYGQSKKEVQSKHDDNYNILVERKELSI